MRVKLSLPYLITFALLLIVMMELHEIVHITIGQWICGCWGPRDFNVWALCSGCKESQSLSWLATLAGPLFSFALMWWGMFWLSSIDGAKKAIGFSLIFTNIPFGRITTVMMGGGDEMVVVRHFLDSAFSRTQMILICSTIVLSVGVPPIIAAFRSIQNKKAWLYILGFLTLPLLFLLLYTLIGLNTLLSVGFLSTEWIMGTPLLITLHTLIALIFLILTWKNLGLLNSVNRV